jgi:hypothetical protein
MYTDFLEANYHDTLNGANSFTTATASGGGGGGGVSGVGDCDFQLASASTSHTGGRRLPIFVKLAQGATAAA